MTYRGINLIFVIVVVFGTAAFGLPTPRDTCDCGNFKIIVFYIFCFGN